MFDLDDFLDRAKAAAGVESDYALAVKVLGYTRATSVSNWRTGVSTPNVSAVIQLCTLTGDDPDHVTACLQAMRAANDEEAEVWQRIADRLRRSSLSLAGAAVALAAALSGAGVTEAPGALLAHDTQQGMRIMSSLLLSWILYRTVTRRCRFPNARAPLMSIRLSPSRHRA